MKFAFNEEQEELRRQARAFLDKHSSSERVRAAMQIDRGYEEDVWRRIGGELGFSLPAKKRAFIRIQPNSCGGTATSPHE